ncbi:PREDICTED: partner of Y14 and mago [Polistes dominula]|uniref:Partner of Y14 and mago n=1 Tax=Polistes dominula TaxID=743375 RepID=A0ABM1J4T7_POLDO|nr:PREDICTED: partner of Y14 and mago [Polistes dominula]
MASNYIKDEQGGTFIPASQRPDGTWRKPRRVKDGYIPQEEVPLYESKGKQFIKNKPIYPVGASPEFIAQHKAKQEALAAKAAKSAASVQPKPENKKKKRKSKNKNTEIIIEELSKTTISQAKVENKVVVALSNEVNKKTDQQQQQQQTTVVDTEKRIKGLRKKIREIESLEEKIKSGLLKNPEKEILEKMRRKNEIINEIKTLEDKS